MNKQQSSGSFVSGEPQVGSPADYLRRVAALYRSIWEGQLALLKEVSRVSPGGLSSLDVSELVGRAANTWGTWLAKFRAFDPGSDGANAPILAFVVDSDAEMSTIQSIRVGSVLAAGDVRASHLFALGAREKPPIDRKHIMVRLESGELRVGLVDLGHRTKQRRARGITPGRYAAVISDGDEHPVALLDVTLLD